MGCKFTKVRDQRSRDDGGKMSEVISQSSSFTDSKKDLESHTAPVTREIIEKCQQAILKANTDEDEVLSLHMYPPSYTDGYSDTISMAAESEMDITFCQDEEIADYRQVTPISDVSSLSVQSRYPSSISSRLSNFFRIGKRSKQNIHGDVSVNGDNGGDGNTDAVSSSGCEWSPTPTLKYAKKVMNGDIAERDDMPDLDIEDDGRPSSSSSSEDSVLPPQLNCRVVARPNAARGTRKRVQADPDPAEIAHRIVEFEAEVEQLIGEHAIPTRDYRNRQLRPRGARGPRLPSFSLQFQNPRPGSGASTESGMRYSKHFADTVSRPQLTVRGLTATNDCLTKWMVSQQRKDSERL
ncbi:uncharacterized protein LOC117338394 [Pecten maximus]|uniref:uncharacterized protein LOC117338394 n=1 Tax=Pecten maximus TaxID=6579 RepID=UPI001458C1EE|nr:uncharacterized protein LOC117338394 [Pecten maximus]